MIRNNNQGGETMDGLTVKDIERFNHPELASGQGVMLLCFPCGRYRIFKNDGKLKCPVCKHKKVIG